MSERYPKRLIEVDLPIARISAHARREKSIRHGHISTLHIWWARRPLAACRAVICAALWPDPADELCPQAFRDAAAKQLTAFAQRVFPGKITPEGHQLQATASDQSRKTWETLLKRDSEKKRLDPGNDDDQLIIRDALLDFIADFANWDNSTVPAYLATSRAITQAAHEALGGVLGTRPLVVDPFAGGGSIPLEALRVGADAFASDLNPVAVLLNKVVLEYIPKYGQRLADEVRKWGQWVKEQAEQELTEFYPKDPDGATPIAYLWARTILSETPGGGKPIEVPLLRSLWLSKYQNRRRAIRWVRDKSGNVITDEVRDPVRKQNVLRPRLEIFSPEKDREVGDGTVASGAATCPVTNYTTPAANVKAQLSEHDGGAITSRLFAVYVDGTSGRSFRSPIKEDFLAFEKAVALSSQWLQECSSVFPDESINPLRPYKNSRGISAVTRIGCNTFGALYNRRQAIANLTFYRVLGRLECFDKEFDEALQSALSLAIDRLVYQNTTVSRWDSSRTTIKGAFSKQALAVVWDYAEANPFSGASADWDGAIDWIVRFVEANRLVTNQGEVLRASATDQVLPSDSVDALVTDPPYFAAIPYADLSDFFYVWLRRGLQKIHPSLFGSPLTEKATELIVTNAQKADDGANKDEQFFQRGMTAALKAKRDAVKPGGVSVVVYAEGTTAGWEAVLAAIIDAGWIVTSSWPIDTEMSNRTQAQGAASLQSSVHIVCRPREDQTGALIEDVGEWRDVLAELPKRIHEWMPRLATEGVVGADAIFACLGPALEIFSRYSRVEKADGSPVPLKDYLEEVWSSVSTEALSMIFKDADAAGLEPDARLTAMWLWTIGGGTGKAGANGNAIDVVPSMVSDDDAEELSSGKATASGGFTLEFDAARKIAQGLGVHLEQSNSIVEVKGDKARLLPVDERIQHLFGKDETATAARGKKKAKAKQRSLFEELDALEAEAEEAAVGELKPHVGKTVLDRVHQSMILFASGRGETLRRFLVDDGAGKDARFWKLAQSLSALYSPGTNEKRWVDGVLARKKGLGL